MSPRSLVRHFLVHRRRVALATWGSSRSVPLLAYSLSSHPPLPNSTIHNYGTGQVGSDGRSYGTTNTNINNNNNNPHQQRKMSSSSPMSSDLNDDTKQKTSLNEFFNPTETHLQLRHMLRDFVKNEVEPQAMEYNRNEDFNLPLLKQLGELGLLGLTVDEQYGGSGLDATAVCLVHEELSYSDPAFCLSYLAHSLLLVNNLNVNGSHEQKSRFLPGCCTGELIGGMGMSEPGAGTDVLGMKTTATLRHHDANTIGTDDVWSLTGQKMWITNGTLDGGKTPGDLFLVYARTGPERSDISSFIVERDAPGFFVGQQIKDKLGMRASPTAELVFDNTPIAKSNLVGDVNNASICMMRNLEVERIGLAAMALGIARRCIDVMNEYAKDRKAFGKSLWQFGQIQAAISTSYAEYMAGRSYVYALANSLDLNSYGNGLDADGTKLFCAAMAKTVADRAIQVLGGYGYVGEYNVERLWRDAKLLEIGGGTNESHHKNMGRDLQRTNLSTRT